MANKTVYPFGTGGQLPSSIGIINDLTTGGADKALSAEMGKSLNNKLYAPIVPTFYDGALRTGGVIAADSSYQYSTFVDISSCDSVRISTNLYRSGSQSYDVTICVYDANGDYIRDAINVRDISSTNGTVAVENYIYTVQQGDAYIRMANKKNGTVVPKLELAIKALSSKHDSILSGTNKIIGSIDNLSDLTGIWQLRLASNQSRLYNTIIDVTGSLTINITLTDTSLYDVAVAEFTTDVSSWNNSTQRDSGWKKSFTDYKTREDAKSVHIRVRYVDERDISSTDISDIISSISIVGASLALDNVKLNDPLLTQKNIKQIIDMQVASVQKSMYVRHSVVKAINHRGYNTVAPENTMPAFRLSAQNGFAYVETDVQFTSDNVPVLLHDSTINRTARNADGTSISETINISSITYEEALDYDFGIYKGAAYAGTQIPTLQEFCVFCRATSIHPYIELKSGTAEQIAAAVAIVNGCGLRGNVSFISFSKDLLGYVKNVDDGARLGFLLGGAATSAYITIMQNLKTNNNEVFFDSSNSSVASISLCKAANIPYEVWTIDADNTILDLDPYITGITSNNLNASVILYENEMG